MASISVQCRLMPDIHQTGEHCVPGIFYNILVSAANEKGVIIPCSVKFRATAALNDPENKQNGTDWSQPLKSSLLGSVLWSVNALTDPLPAPIEVEVDAEGIVHKVTVQPAANLAAMLQRLNEKTTDEWCGFLSKGYHASDLMHFAAEALSASVNTIYSDLMKSPSGADLTALMKASYNESSGILSVTEQTNKMAAARVTSHLNLEGSSDLFGKLLDAMANQAERKGEAGVVLKYFIKDVPELFQVIQLLLEQCGREMKDLFDWIELNLPWEDIGEAHDLVKSVAETLIKDLIGSNAKVTQGWGAVMSSFRSVWSSASGQMGERTKELIPLATGLQQSWKEHSPKLSKRIQIDHQQFETGWIGWRLTHSLSGGPAEPTDLIQSILKALDFSGLSKALNELSEALSGLDMSEEAEESLGLIQAFLTKIIRGDTSQVEQLLSGGPELNAVLAAPQELFKLMDQLQSKGNSMIKLVHACLELVYDFITAPIEVPFLEALKPWMEPLAASDTQPKFSFLDLMILGLVTPGVVLFRSATQRGPFTLNDLHGLIGTDWSLNDIPIKDFSEKFVNTLGNQSDQPKYRTAEKRKVNPTPLPQLQIPGSPFPEPPPHFKEVCDGICLFLELCAAISEAMADIINLVYDAEEIAVSGATSGNEEEKSATDTVDWGETAKEFLTLSYESFGFGFKTTINLIRTAELYMLNEEAKARWAEIGPARLVAFNPVYPAWVGLANSGYWLGCGWALLLVDFIMKVSEDEELGAGAADFEISGAAYTEADAQMTKLLKFVKGFTHVSGVVIGIFINKAALANTMLYDDVLDEEVIPMADKVLGLIEAGKDRDKMQAARAGEQIGEQLSPWHDWELTKLVCEQIGETSRNFELAKDLIDKIPEYGSELAFAWDLGCILMANTMTSFSLAISVYQFNETYHPVDQAKSMGDHK